MTGTKNAPDPTSEEFQAETAKFTREVGSGSAGQLPLFRLSEREAVVNAEHRQEET
jgi:hypothetical protein